MPAPIAVQLYTVWDHLDKDYKGTLTRIAEMGYVGIETCGYSHGVDVKNAAKLIKDLGLTVCSAHVGMPTGDNVQKVLDEATAAGCKRVISGVGREGFKSADAIKGTCDTFNEAAANVAKAGLTFGVHNHWWEYEKLADGTPAYKVMLQHVDPRVFFELDVYWIQTGGCNPAAVVAEFGARAPLHVTAAGKLFLLEEGFARLRDYAKKYGAGPGWQHYTGTLAASKATQVAFNAYRGNKMEHAAVTLVRAAPGRPWVRLDGFATPEDVLKELRDEIASR